MSEEDSKSSEAGAGTSAAAGIQEDQLNIRVVNAVGASLAFITLFCLGQLFLFSLLLLIVAPLQEQAEVCFKIRKTTKLQRLMEAYCTREGLSSSAARFLFDGKRVLATDTPEALGLGDNDVIDVQVEQTGGMYQ